jgi:hypothetical protein
MLMTNPQIILCSIVDSSIWRRSTSFCICCPLSVSRWTTASGSCRGVYVYISGKVKGSRSLVFSRFYPGQPNHLSTSNQTRPDPFTTQICLALRKPKPPLPLAPKKIPNHTTVPLLLLPHLQERRARPGQRPTRSSCFSKSSGRKSRILI